MVALLNRRAFVGALAAAGGVAIAGCGRAQRKEAANVGPANMSTMAPQHVTQASMTVYRNPECGCCEAWAALAQQAGYQVSIVDVQDMDAIKRKYGVPPQLASCHTAIVGGYAIEGHVPLDDVERLLENKPRGIKGIAVPGMPVGSPGMEVPGGAKEPFQVMAFDRAGRVSPFRA